MIKPLEEYSPEDRAFVEWVQLLRSQPPKPPNNPGPWIRRRSGRLLLKSRRQSARHSAKQFGEDVIDEAH